MRRKGTKTAAAMDNFGAVAALAAMRRLFPEVPTQVFTSEPRASLGWMFVLLRSLLSRCYGF